MQHKQLVIEMKKQNLSVTIEMETVSELLAVLSKKRKEFRTKSDFIRHAVNFSLNEKEQRKEKGGAA